jgi:uncharacterized membrane protein YeaQ/YmgE (transglycosylase-associated protein family)
MIHFIVWIIVSGFAGFVASKIINKSGSGLFMDIVIGIVGGFVGGFIVNHIPFLEGIGGHTGFAGFIIEVVVAILGAMLVIWLYDMIFRRHHGTPATQ